VPNTGKISILFSKTTFRQNKGNDDKLLLNGAFRIVKSRDRKEFYESTGWTKHVPMIWSQLTDMDVFNIVHKPIDKKQKLLKDLPKVKSLKTSKQSVVEHYINDVIEPNVGQKAVQAMTLTKRVETVLQPEQWKRYFSTRSPRFQLATEIAKCSMGLASKTFCQCWARKERSIIPYNIDDSTAFPPCPPTSNQAGLARTQFATDSSMTTTRTCNKNRNGDPLWDYGPCGEHSGASLCVSSLSVNTNEQKQQCCYGDDGNLLDALTSPGGGRVQFTTRHNKRDVSSMIEPGDLWLAQQLEEHLINRKPQELCCAQGENPNSKECQTFRRLRRGGSAKIFRPPTPPGIKKFFHIFL
jgi:hypothetical protein